MNYCTSGQIDGRGKSSEEEEPGVRLRLLQGPADEVAGDVCRDDHLPAVFFASVFQEDQPCGESFKAVYTLRVSYQVPGTVVVVRSTFAHFPEIYVRSAR